MTVNSLQLGTISVSCDGELPDINQVLVRSSCSICGASSRRRARLIAELHQLALDTVYHQCLANGHYTYEDYEALARQSNREYVGDLEADGA